MSNQSNIKRMLMLLVIVHLLAGCSMTIDAKEAEEIAIQSAKAEGYSNPRLFTDFNRETIQKYQYSVKKNKDLKTWQVRLITDEREYPENISGDLVYYIDIENGDIVDKISGVE